MVGTNQRRNRVSPDIVVPLSVEINKSSLGLKLRAQDGKRKRARFLHVGVLIYHDDPEAV